MADAALSETVAKPTPARAPDDVLRGIVLLLGSSVVFSMMNAGVKLVSGRLPPPEIAFFRQVFSLIPVLFFVIRAGGIAVIRTRRPLGHLFRGVVGNSAMIPLFLSFKWLPLADATALTFGAPLFITALSVPLLKEAVGLHRWSAVLVGFVGVMIIINPGGGNLGTGATYGALVGVAAAFISALMSITIRQLNKTEQPITIVFYFTTIGLVLFGSSMPFFWVTPSWHDLGVMFGVGFLGGLAQFSMTSAYRHAPAALLAPFAYSTILWSTLFGYLIWDQLPSLRTVLGVAIVIASGLYILYRETRKRVRIAATAG